MRSLLVIGIIWLEIRGLGEEKTELWQWQLALTRGTLKDYIAIAMGTGEVDSRDQIGALRPAKATNGVVFKGSEEIPVRGDSSYFSDTYYGHFQFFRGVNRLIYVKYRPEIEVFGDFCCIETDKSTFDLIGFCRLRPLLLPKTEKETKCKIPPASKRESRYFKADISVFKGDLENELSLIRFNGHDLFFCGGREKILDTMERSGFTIEDFLDFGHLLPKEFSVLEAESPTAAFSIRKRPDEKLEFAMRKKEPEGPVAITFVSWSNSLEVVFDPPDLLSRLDKEKIRNAAFEFYQTRIQPNESAENWSQFDNVLVLNFACSF